MSFLTSNSALKHSQVDVHPKAGEAILQSAGYTHLLQIGSAADLPSLSDSPVWRKVFQLQETVGTVTNYLLPNRSKSGLEADDVALPLDDKDPTKLAYLGLQQLLSGRIPKDFKAAKNLLSSLGKPLDDRKMLLEDVVGWLATAGRSRQHGPNSLINGVQGQFINLLWGDLSHPPTVDLSPEHRYRSADGSFNNLTGLPYLGAANQPYARSVKPIQSISPDVAEPEDLFDAILRRPASGNGFKRHPAGISSLLFAFANVIIHDLFWTNNNSEAKPIPGAGAAEEAEQAAGYEYTETKTHQQWQNLTSSYLSLDPLYGIDQQEQDSVRDGSDENLGRGLLYNDVFASSRLLLMPAASAALLILFSRNHNRVARKVLELNELKKWNPDIQSLTREQRKTQDDEIFGTARLVNCGYFVNMILHDYLQAILGTVQADSDWSLDPRLPIKNILGSTPKAVGNSVSIEFNILYRWHATISQKQTLWLEEKMEKGLPSRKWDDLDAASFRKAMAALQSELNGGPGSEPKDWKLSKYEVELTSLGGIERVESGVYERDPVTGKFNDRDLARILRDSTNDVAGAFGARHTPAVMRWIDCQGMRTARDVWRACTLNEFRTFLNLKAFDKFEEWNSDPEIARAMEDLVGSPDNIPLHVGLHGEEAKSPRLGAGLCPNYTISRAILSDAVALVRGDRFYTDSATADSMTDWGLLDCQPDIRAGSYGGMLQKLIINNLPNQYAFNDVALIFPFMVPDEMYRILENISIKKALSYSLNPVMPSPIGFKFSEGVGQTAIHEISDTELVQADRMAELLGIAGIKSNIPAVYESLDTIISGDEWKVFSKFLAERIRQSSVKRSPVNSDLTVDILRDVTNPLVSGWLAHMFGLVETGLHSKQLLLCALSDIYKYLNEPQMTFANRSAARVAASGLAWQLKFHIEAALSPSLSIGKIIKKGAAGLTVGALNVLDDTIKILSGQPVMKNVHADCKLFYTALTRKNNEGAKLTTDELVADCLRAAATLAYALSHGTAHALDYLIPKATGPQEQGEELGQSLQDLIKIDEQDRKSFEKPSVREKYRRHGLEASRLNHWNTSLKALVVTREHFDRRSWQQALGVVDGKWNLTRDDFEYKRLLDVTGHCLRFYEELISVAIREVVIKLPKVRKAWGKQGELNSILLANCNSPLKTMHIRYDGMKLIGGTKQGEA